MGNAIYDILLVSPRLLLPQFLCDRKTAKELLQSAQKVILYRGDVLSREALAEQAKLTSALKEQLLQPYDLAALEAAMTALHESLVRNGGKIYPMSGAGEWVEMVVMAAIVAGGIRSFFLQPFKIPTNSMWPTYNGMTSTVRAPQDPVPDGLTRFVQKATQWTSTYVVTAPTSGEVLLALEYLGLEGTVKRYRLRSRSTGDAGYTLYVGNTTVLVDTPAEFGVEGVLLRTFFPDYAKLPLKKQDAERWEQLLQQAVRENKVIQGPTGPMLRTGYLAQAGEPVLNFDILTGDMLFVDRVSYHFINPARGDTFVFTTQNIPGLNDRAGNPSQNYYVKRLAGIPGERLFVDTDGRLYVNGSVVTYPPPMVLNSQRATDQGYYGYLAFIGDYAYSLPLDKEYSVTAGHFYALGDNSANSFDSRGWGEVPAKDVVGKPLFILHPFTSHWGAAK